MPAYSPYVQERWELVEYVNSTVLDDVAQPVWRESSAAGELADVYGLSRLSTSGGSENLAIADTYLEDGLGSVSAVLREGGAVAASLSYSPWGEEELATESLPGYGDRFERPHYGYNAEQSSPEGGLQYLRARWYDPSMGTFGSRDSYLGDAADPATLNRYAYAGGNPVASCDPTGHESRVKYGGANANRIRRLASNPRRGAGASTGTWMSRNYTQKALSSKKPGLLTTRRVSNPVLASGGKRRAAVQSSAKSVVSTGVGKMQAWVAGQTTGRSLTSRLAATRGGTRAAAKRSALYGQARRDRDRQMELFCTTAEYFGSPGKRSLVSDPHTTLDIVGTLDPTPLSDGANALAYWIEGDYENMAISAIAALLPYGGDLLKGGKLAKSIAKAASEATEESAAALKLGRSASSKILARNMEEVGISRPSSGYAAHHIVAGGDGRADPARQILKHWEIDINDPSNGIFLPAQREIVSESAYHPGLHTNKYYDEINIRLTRVSGSKKGVLEELDKIREELLAGTFEYR